MDVAIEKSWKEKLLKEFEQPYFKSLVDFLTKEQKDSVVYPQEELVFSAFDNCPFNQVKVVILGQDPYHGEGQANGLSFSVNDGVKFPPSLRNIFKELHDDLGKDIPDSGNLDKWAKQGVLLLNATLTVRAKEPGSHQKKGWEKFTDAVINLLNKDKDKVVFVLWGAYAQKKGTIIDESKHLVVTSSHPSPFSVHKGFFGSRPFSKVNDYLKLNRKEEIDW